MKSRGNRVRRELFDLLAPLQASWRAVVYTACALALLLLHLHQGQRAFFAEHLAADLLPWASPVEVAWWGALYQFAGALVLFLLVPAALLRWVAKERLTDLGLGLGDVKLGFAWVVPIGLLVIALPGGLSASTMPDFLAEYPLAELAAASPGRFALYELAYGLLYYVSYEAFFRGFVQFGLRPHIGPLSAILVQTAMTTLLHLGKPDAEIWSALLAGFLFGVVAFRTRSVWPLVVVHWGLGLLTDLFCAQAKGIWG